MEKLRYIEEYRINKKGCECYRSEFGDEAREKLAALQAKKPGVYTMQTRHRRIYARTGAPYDAGWSPWF